MIALEHKQLVIDGQPRLVMAGEVHYFRVAREEWDQRLDLVVEAGCTAVRPSSTPARSGACGSSPGPVRS